ncbi:MAG: YggS family pyridoxal phosphate-dependent enzyme [Bdellovibrionota bacterium]
MGFSEGSVKNEQSSKRASNLKDILKNISSPKQKILAVSKLQPPEKIKALYDEGQTDFAENYIQEALKKIALFSELNITWHLIGPIQKNKIKLLKKNFAYIHSVDSFELAEKISENALKIKHTQKCFIQLNLSGEASKSGYSKIMFLKDWPRLKKLEGLEIVGLMTMPPLENVAEKNRAFFKELKYIGTKINLHEFSMGTSDDYQIALEEGATWIRLGTMLFGKRTLKSLVKNQASEI